MTNQFDRLKGLLSAPEDEHLEFKEAKGEYSFENLVKYCVALANEGGGTMVLGMTDRVPRSVVGTNAFVNLGRTKAGLIERLHLRVAIEEYQHRDGRVLIFDVPSRPRGVPLQDKGAHWMRGGDSLVAMTNDQIKRILDEVGLDYSAEICPAAASADLNPKAIERFRAMWRRKSGNTALDHLPDDQILADAELVIDGGITYAALVLLGTHKALGRFLPQAETIWEYRSSEASLTAQQRKEYREGFFLWYDDLWDAINLRNDVQQFQDGLFIQDIPTFNEVVIREAILNAVSHRDYRLAGSVFVRQYPQKLDIVSPGGFPPGVTPETILDRQVPRNRRIAEAFQRCGLVERSGQGANRMFEECIKEGKPRPDFSGTDEHQVALTLRGDIQDPQFLRFLEKIGRERLASFTTNDLLVLDLVHREESLPDHLKDRLRVLSEYGVIERFGRGRGTRYVLSRGLYGFIGRKGAYTRKRGLDRETNKELLMRHIEDNRREGCQLHDLREVLPSLTRPQVQTLLRELRREKRIYSKGRTKAARWYPSPFS